MNEIQTFLEQARQLVVQHAPADMLREAVPFALVSLIAGIGLSVLGAKLSRVGLTTALAMGGGAIGLFIGRGIGLPAAPCGLVAAVMAGVIGYQTFRMWVGVVSAVVCASVALGFFGYHRVLPHMGEFESTFQAAPAVAASSQSAFTLPSPEAQQAYRDRTPAQWLNELRTYVAGKDAQFEQNGRAVVLVALMTGLFFGVLAMRTALVLSTSIVGTALVTTGMGTILTHHMPQSYKAFQANPAMMGMVVGAFFVGSLVVQTMLTRKAPNQDAASKKSKS